MILDPSKIKITPLLDTLRLETISDAEYFSAKYSNYISNSRLGLINPEQDGTPEKFFNGGFNAFSDSLVFGSAVHELVLQPDNFFLCESVNRPTAKVGYIADYTYDPSGMIPTEEKFQEALDKYDYFKGNPPEKKRLEVKNQCLNYWRNRALFERSNKDPRIPIYLDEKSRVRLQGCLNSINDNDRIQELLKPKSFIGDVITANEQTILLDIQVEVEEYEPFVLKLKSKLDNFTIDGCMVTVNDVKTTSTYVDDFKKSLDYFRYYREMGMYSWLLSLCAQKFYNIKVPKIKSNFLVVRTVDPFPSIVYPMNTKLFRKGFKEFVLLTKLVAYYVATDPRYKHFAAV